MTPMPLERVTPEVSDRALFNALIEWWDDYEDLEERVERMRWFDAVAEHLAQNGAKGLIGLIDAWLDVERESIQMRLLED